MHFQILDVGSIWMKEFASALSAQADVVAWEPVMTGTALLQEWQRIEAFHEPPLDIHRFPLQRGYMRAPVRELYRYEHAVLRRLRTHCGDPAHSTLICTTPFYAPVAERWPGPVIYYVTDLTVRYAGLNPQQVIALDRRLCRIARTVCPNSRRLRDYLVDQAGCLPEKITIVPNATREGNIARAPLLVPADLLPDIRHLPRPIAGVIGNLAANMDWEFIEESMLATPLLTWVLVGPATMPIPDRRHASARARVLQKAHCTGPRQYGELQSYARCFDVAILPYRKHEPTYSGSSTRFYEHLAACRPMIATRGFAELLEKGPLLTLVDTAAELRVAVDALAVRGFSDGLETARWQASRSGTWEARAASVLEAVAAPVESLTM